MAGDERAQGGEIASRSRWIIVVVSGLAALALAGGVVWMIGALLPRADAATPTPTPTALSTAPPDEVELALLSDRLQSGDAEEVALAVAMEPNEVTDLVTGFASLEIEWDDVGAERIDDPDSDLSAWTVPAAVTEPDGSESVWTVTLVRTAGGLIFIDSEQVTP